jgi:cell division protein FtsW
MARKLKSDKILFLATLLLVCASIVMVYSASAPRALEHPQQQFVFLVKQAMWAALGLAILGLAMRFDYQHFKQPAVIWTMLGLAAIGLVVVLFAPAVKGSHRWVGIGGFGIQPSEFAKLAVVVFSAALLERRMSRINDVAYSLTPIGIVILAMVGLILLEPDFGSAMSLVAIAALVIFAAGLAYRYLLGAALAIVPLAGLLLVGAPYRRDRLLAFLDPWKDAQGTGFQLVQSTIAVGTGGVFGRGLAAGIQKLYYLPEPHNDFIYAVIAEEVGLVGATAVLVCFALITWRGLRVASRAPDAFGALLATGITGMIAVQAFVNISVVLGLMPTKGIALPLVSAGGSSLLINTLAIGILLNISQHASAEARGRRD